MVQLTIRQVLVSAWLVLVATSVVAGGTLQTRILQYYQDRLYFSAGTEAHIYPHNRFIIMCGADSIYEGCISESFLGVSYSFPTDEFFDTLPLDSCAVQIEAAEIDSVATIKLGLSGIESQLWLDRMIDAPIMDSLNPNPLDLIDSAKSHGKAAIVRSHPRYIDLVFKMQLDELDGFISFTNHAQELPQNSVIDAPAPFVVAMIPNLSREVNRGGHLAVSLYYRFNEDNLPLLFRGDNVAAIHCFRSSALAGVRPFAFSPQKGRELLQQLKHRPKRLHLWASDEPLEKLALFFADVLSRDRIEVQLVDRFEDADLSFMFIQFDEQDDLPALIQINDFLGAAPAEYSFQQEILDSVSICLTMAAGETDSTQRARYLLRADQYLMHDLGVLPLFRPRVFFHASKLLTGYRFNPSGRFVLNDLMKLRLPSPGSRCSQ